MFGILQFREHGLQSVALLSEVRLCQNFNVTPTFARVDKDKTSKWKKSSESYSKNVLAEELRAKIKQSEALASEINAIYSNIRQACSLFRYTCILRIISSLRKDYNHEVMSVHTRKISRLLNMEVDVDEHISNISSHELSFFQKLVLCRGLRRALRRPTGIWKDTLTVRTLRNWLPPH